MLITPSKCICYNVEGRKFLFYTYAFKSIKLYAEWRIRVSSMIRILDTSCPWSPRCWMISIKRRWGEFQCQVDLLDVGYYLCKQLFDRTVGQQSTSKIHFNEYISNLHSYLSVTWRINFPGQFICKQFTSSTGNWSLVSNPQAGSVQISGLA